MFKIHNLQPMKLIVVWLTVGATLLCQQNATLTGNVKDASDAAVGDASIRVVNVQTGEAFSSLTAASGGYTVPLIKPGRYDLTVEAQGFKQYRQTGITLETGATARVDLQLEIGAVADSVTVEADAPLLNADTSSVGSVVRNSTIANMPLVGC